MQVTLAPLVEQGLPPPWPPRTDAPMGDERIVCELTRKLGLDRRGYERIVADTVKLTERLDYKRTRASVSYVCMAFMSAGGCTGEFGRVKADIGQ